MTRTLDISHKDARVIARQRFAQARKAEHAYGVQLRAVARHVGHIVKGFTHEGIIKDVAALVETLQRYSQVLRPWAKAVATKMVADVARRDEKAWIEHGRSLGNELRKQLRQAPLGRALDAVLHEQVDLITSLPTKAAERVHKLTVEALTDSTRAEEVAKQIFATSSVTQSRAMLIARTEVARTASVLTEVRAKHIGSDGYIWRTAMDSDVRPLHKKLEGKLIKWDDPPIAGERGERAHAGQIYNCRCYPEPVLPDQL